MVAHLTEEWDVFNSLQRLVWSRYNGVISLYLRTRLRTTHDEREPLFGGGHCPLQRICISEPKHPSPGWLPASDNGHRLGRSTTSCCGFDFFFFVSIRIFLFFFLIFSFFFLIIFFYSRRISDLRSKILPSRIPPSRRDCMWMEDGGKDRFLTESLQAF